MNNKYNEYFGRLMAVFNRGYSTAVSGMKDTIKNELASHSSMIFRRWFYAALIDETTLSPANIMLNLNNEYKKPSTLVPKLIKTEENNAFSFDTVHYSLTNHPLVLDAKTVLESCSPVIYLDKNDKPENYNITNRLTINENCYADFIISILIRCGILRRIPSIGIHSYQPSATAFEYFNKNHFNILSDFTSVAIDIFMDSISEFAPINRSFKKTIYKMLEKPLFIDDLFENLYSLFGMDFDDALIFDTVDFDMDNLSEMQHALMASTFFIGVALDKHFLTPFSYYFQFIRPLYTLSFILSDEIKLLSGSPRDGDESDIILYSPCSQYFLTEIGYAFLGINKTDTDTDIGESVRKDVKLPQLFDTIERLPSYRKEAGKSNYKGSDSESLHSSVSSLRSPVMVYQLKIKIMKDKRYWVTAEFTEKSSVSDIHNFICFIFNLDTFCEYNFYVSETENPFLEYGTRSASKNKKKDKEQSKLNSTTLGNLNVTNKQKLLYILYNSDEPLFNRQTKTTIRFELEVTEIKRHEGNDFFPRTVKTSKLFKASLDGE